MLTETQINNAKSSDKTVKIWDERGLYLEITPKGAKRWRFKYRFHGVEKLLSMGIFPDISLEQARYRRDEAHIQLAVGMDPSVVRKARKMRNSPYVILTENSIKSSLLNKIAEVKTMAEKKTRERRTDRDRPKHNVADITCPYCDTTQPQKIRFSFTDAIPNVVRCDACKNHFIVIQRTEIKFNIIDIQDQIDNTVRQIPTSARPVEGASSRVEE